MHSGPSAVSLQSMVQASGTGPTYVTREAIAVAFHGLLMASPGLPWALLRSLRAAQMYASAEHVSTWVSRQRTPADPKGSHSQLQPCKRWHQHTGTCGAWLGHIVIADVYVGMYLAHPPQVIPPLVQHRNSTEAGTKSNSCVVPYSSASRTPP